MVIFKILALISFLIYSFSIIFFIIGILKLRKLSSLNKSEKLSASIVIAARNEEDHLPSLLKSLKDQKINTEIIIVNDRSDDSTEEILKNNSGIKYFNIDKIENGVSPKKNALKKGIDEAHGDIIFLTDADCTVPANWVESMINYFKENTGVVSGLSYLKENNIFHRMMNLEYFALSLCTAGAIGWNFPVISTGNNLAYRKKAFEEVNGFKNILNIDSGDDDLIVQKISEKTNWKFNFSFNPNSFVKTEPVSGIKEFMNQRRRWASRGLDYKTSIKLPLFFIYLFYLFLLLLPIFALVVPGFFSFIWDLLLINVFLEVLLLTVGLIKIKKIKYLLLYPIAKILHIPYIVLMPALGILRGFKWK